MSSSSSSGCSCPNCPSASCCFTFTVSGVGTGTCCSSSNGTWKVNLDTGFTFYCFYDTGMIDTCNSTDFWEMYDSGGWQLVSSEEYFYTASSFDCINGGTFTFGGNFGSCAGPFPSTISVTPCGGSTSSAGSSSMSSVASSSSSSMGCPCCCCGSSSGSSTSQGGSSNTSSSSNNNPIVMGCVDCLSGNLTYYYITAAGITGSADCLSHNVSDYQMTARGPLTSACTWDSFYPAFPGTDLWSLFITGVGTAQVYAFDRFGNIQCFYNCNTFNCLTNNTFTLGTVTTCGGWPATITISTS